MDVKHTIIYKYVAIDYIGIYDTQLHWDIKHITILGYVAHIKHTAIYGCVANDYIKIYDTQVYWDI